MYTFAPLPQLTDLFRALCTRSLVSENPAKCWGQNKGKVFWYARAAWAIHRIADWWTVNHNGKAPHCWLPDYFCNEAIALLRDTGTKLRFYPVTCELEPDWDACEKIASREGEPDLFFLVHYFAVAADGIKARTFCEKSGALLVEDAAQVLLPERGIGTFGNFVFFSPRKVLAAPDGAFLVVHNSVDSEAFNFEVQATSNSEKAWHLNWIAKRIIQKYVPSSCLRARNRHLPDFNSDHAPISTLGAAQISRIGHRIISCASPNLDALADNRKQCALAWREACSTLGDACIPFFSANKEGKAPYRFVLKCRDNGWATHIFSCFRRHGIAVESWPDLPPEVLASPREHEAAISLRNTLLFIPVHTPLDMIPVELLISSVRTGRF